MSNPSYWWELALTHPQIEEASYLLFENDARGIELVATDSARCYFECTHTRIEAICSSLAQLGFAIGSVKEVKLENWVGKSQELWTPLKVGGLSITPVDEAAARRAPPQDNELYIVPGMGFGTGHHDSTAMVLELLQTPQCNKAATGPILDLGTGSGILAIALARLTGQRVLGIDTDPDAIGNARLNAELNRCHDLVDLSVNTLDQVLDRGPFSLIVANLYAEVLCELEPLLNQALTDDGLLIMSGIMTERVGLVATCFSEPNWDCLQVLNTERWHSRLVTKRRLG